MKLQNFIISKAKLSYKDIQIIYFYQFWGNLDERDEVHQGCSNLNRIKLKPQTDRKKSKTAKTGYDVLL
jgi:hypothetical protein